LDYDRLDAPVDGYFSIGGYHLTADGTELVGLCRNDRRIEWLVPSLDRFRLARRAFRYFCVQRGIYGPEFGYFGGYAISFLIAGICNILSVDATASHILAGTIKRYYIFPWRTQAIWLPGEKQPVEVIRKPEDLMFIPSVSYPYCNTMKTCESTVATIERELRLACTKISNQFTFDMVCSDGLQSFYTDYENFIVITSMYWGTDGKFAKAWIKWVQSNILLFLRDLEQTIPKAEIRFWPQKFTINNVSNDDEVRHFSNDDTYSVFFIGVKDLPMDHTALTDFLDTTRRKYFIGKLDEKDEAGGMGYVDRHTDCNIVSRSNVRRFGLEVDTRLWEWTPDAKDVESGPATLETETETSDDDDYMYTAQSKKITKESETRGKNPIPATERQDSQDSTKARTEPESDKDQITVVESAEGEDPNKPTPDAKGSKGAEGKTSQAPKPELNPKLRSWNDVLNHILFEPRFDDKDYVVGYLDRSKGIVECPVISFTKDVSHKEFIPLHRVLYFKNRQSGLNEWDRRTREDYIFGSGLISCLEFKKASPK